MVILEELDQYSEKEETISSKISSSGVEERKTISKEHSRKMFKQNVIEEITIEKTIKEKIYFIDNRDQGSRNNKEVKPLISEPKKTSEFGNDPKKKINLKDNNIKSSVESISSMKPKLVKPKKPKRKISKTPKKKRKPSKSLRKNSSKAKIKLDKFKDKDIKPLDLGPIRDLILNREKFLESSLEENDFVKVKPKKLKSRRKLGSRSRSKFKLKTSDKINKSKSRSNLKLKKGESLGRKRIPSKIRKNQTDNLRSKLPNRRPIRWATSDLGNKIKSKNSFNEPPRRNHTPNSMSAQRFGGPPKVERIMTRGISYRAHPKSKSSINPRNRNKSENKFNTFQKINRIKNIVKKFGYTNPKQGTIKRRPPMKKPYHKSLQSYGFIQQLAKKGPKAYDETVGFHRNPHNITSNVLLPSNNDLILCDLLIINP